MLDLHSHTTCSDGSLTPTQLVAAAAQAGIRVLAITDHDTVSGWDEAFEAGRQWGVEIVPGVELSTLWMGCSLHLLGFYPNRILLDGPLQERQTGRWRRIQAMIDQLAALGMDIDLPPVTGTTPGRPHLAQALVAAGYAKTVREAFDRWLRDGGPVYVPYEPLSAVEGIQLLRRCGAIPVWAHPYLFRGAPVPKVLPALVEAGLLGVEVYRSDVSPTGIRQLKGWASPYGLVETGGSDYHGPNQGGLLNALHLSVELLDPIRHLAKLRQ